MLSVGTSDGIFLIARTDDSWKVTTSALHGLRVEDIAYTDAGIIVATEEGIFEGSLDWSGWKRTLDDVDVRCLAITPDGTIFAGTEGATLYRRRIADESFAEVAGFRELPTARTWTFPVYPHLPNIRSIVISPSDPHRLYIAVEVGGVMRSDDEGETWDEARENIHPDVHELAISAGEVDRLFAVTGLGFYRTMNGAVSWESRNDGFRSHYTVAVANDPNDPERIFASSTVGRPRNWRDRDGGAMAQVYGSTDAGASWHRLLDEGLFEAIDALEVDLQGTVFAGTHGGQILSSALGSQSWGVVTDGLPAINKIVAR